MKKFKWKQIGSAVIAAALMGSMVLPIVSQAQEEILYLQEGTTNQTNTDPEEVFLNKYDGAKRTENFNNNWKFYLGEPGSAEAPEFDDSGWNRITLPHDYSIDQKYNRKLEGESGYLPGGTGWYRKTFTVDKSLEGKRISVDFGGVYMNATVYLNGKQLGTHPYGYTPFSFDITKDVKLGAENVLAVKVEHRTPSSRFYSGSGIYRDVDLVVTNAVHVDKNGTKVETPKLSTEAASGNATVNVKTTVVNETGENASVTVKHTVRSKTTGAEVGTFTTAQPTTVKANSTATVDAEFTVNGIKLWDLKTPEMYVVKTEVMNGEEVLDTYETDYGFRFFEFNNNTGFSLNGKNVKLKGMCMHHDQGALGAVANDRSTERQVEILKEMGVNSIRVTHNPASRELIDACNKHGMLLVEEAFDGWVKTKNSNSQDYANWFNTSIGANNQIMGGNKDMTWAQFDLTAMIKRGQNAPSIIMWSLGNEMWEGTSGYSSEFRTAQTNLIKWANELDKTRPVTTGDNKLKGWDPSALAMAGDLNAAKGVVGMNYAAGNVFDGIHNKHGDWCLYGSETASAVNSRGIYKGMGNRQDYGDHDLTSYDTSAVNWGEVASSAWYEVIKRDFIAGEYVWTGFDYIGEPTPWNDPYGTEGSKKWPQPKSSYFGVIDTAGLPKDTFYFYQSQWNDDVNTLHILPAWNEDVVYKNRENKVPVVVYSDAAKVELWFRDANGKETQIGDAKEFATENVGVHSYQIYKGADKSRHEHENLYLTWMVPYKDGTVFAKAFDASGNQIPNEKLHGRTSVTTAGEAKKLKAEVDRQIITADGQDLSYITVSVTDKDGNLVPNAANNVKFEVTGDGVLAGVDNGRPIDHQSYRDDNRAAFSGQLVGIVRSTKAAGNIQVKITSQGLEPVTVSMQTKAPEGGSETAKGISSVTMPKSYYVKVGNQPQLPQQLDATFTDGSKGKVNVKWDDISKDLIDKAGAFSVTGTVTVEGSDKTEAVYVNVNMIDTVVAILNYSTTTAVGVAPDLPKSRPAVMADGTVLTASFPVEWKLPADGFSQPGEVVVPGVARVFGEAIAVTATVRVQETQYTVGPNIASEAMELTQDIPAEFQSDTLAAIRDGDRTVKPVNSGDNPSLWSNYKNTEKNRDDKDAEIIFEYATKQNFNHISIFFNQDTFSASYPEKGTTKIYVSETGNENSWTEVNAKETAPDTKNTDTGVVEYKYDFDPQGAVFVKIKVVNNGTRTGIRGQFTCTAISEVELNRADAKEFTTNTTTKLKSASIGDLQATQADLEGGSWSTAAKTAEGLKVVPADNASATVLPARRGTVQVIVESEDHKNRENFMINLDADPTDASQDYAGNITYEAGSAQSGNELAKAFDKNDNTYWHTSWRPTNPADRWVIMELQEPKIITGLRYLPRPGSGGNRGESNGTVKTYTIEVKSEKDAPWQKVEVTVGTQEWSPVTAWKLAKLVKPVEAKYIRFSGVETYDDHGGNQYMSAAEIRVKAVDEMPEPVIEELRIKQTPDKTVYTEGDLFDPAGLVLTARYSDDSVKDITYAPDCGMTFEPGLEEALKLDQYKVTVKYSGLKADILIDVNENLVPEGIEVITDPTRTTYTAGEHFNPAGLEIKVKYTNGTYSDPIVYSTANASDFTFAPDLNTALTTGMNEVTVTYAGQSAVIKITVNEKTPVDPEPPVDPEMPVVTEIAVSTPPAKTEYKAGEKFDPTGLVLNVTIEDGTTGEVPYRPETAEFFSFEPGLDTALTAGTQKVTVTFGGKSAEIAISVKAADGTTPNGGSDGTTTPNGNGPAQTGDTFNSGLVIGICVVSAVAICVIVVVLVKKNKKNKN